MKLAIVGRTVSQAGAQSTSRHDLSSVVERHLSAAIVLNATTKETAHLEVKFRFYETPRCVPRLKMSRPSGPRA